MATLLDQTDFDIDDESRLSIEIVPVKLEVFDDATTEGWIDFSIRFLRGKTELVSVHGGALHNTELVMLEKMCQAPPKNVDEFAAMEMDFQLRIKPLENGEYEVFCSINYGRALRQIPYQHSSVSITILTEKKYLLDFANQLRKERYEITKGKRFEIGESYPLN